MKRVAILGLLAMLVSMAAQQFAQGEGCRGDGCSSCGCCKVRKVCKLVPDVKKITTYCYSTKCDDFCLNGHSKCVGTRQVCDCHGSHCEKCMQPTCCEVLTRRLITKTPIVKEKHGWKCVVETVCCGCGECCGERAASDVEAQALIQDAEKLGVVPVSAQEPLVFPIEETSIANQAAVETPAPKAKSLFRLPFVNK
ncbi:MAG: hypothetical protein JSS27_04675 [Planctomycetes bacterium]|nr:hypothetical protein [Planctomycetota bacterium]